MERWRALVVAALVGTGLLGAALVWREKAAAVRESAAPQATPTESARTSGRGIEPRTRASPPAGLSAAPLPLPASAYEPMIDLPAPPPPEEGAGDDFEESGLPRAVFDGKVKLEALSPSEARLAAAKERLGHAIDKDVEEALSASFRRHDEAAAVAIGYLRLKELSEAEAAAIIERELSSYRKEAAAALGVRSDEVERLFTLPRPPR